MNYRIPRNTIHSGSFSTLFWFTRALRLLLHGSRPNFPQGIVQPENFADVTENKGKADDSVRQIML